MGIGQASAPGFFSVKRLGVLDIGVWRGVPN
jgi:hypothetical protein